MFLSETGVSPAMRLRPRTGIVPASVTVAVTFLTVCGAGVVSAARAAGTSPVPGSVQWAYGDLSTASAHRQGLLFGWDASVTFGFGVILGETAGSGGAYTVYVNRTMGLLLSAHYCRPNCATPLSRGSVDLHAWETTLATVNLTSDANVTVGTTPTAAIGMRSSSLTVHEGLTESSQVVNGSVLKGSWTLEAYLNGTESTTFATPLGLLPLSLTSESWSNASSFRERGNASWALGETGGGVLGSATLHDHGHVPFSRSGTVALSGTYNGTKVTLGGSSYDVVSLSLVGPFVLREGFLLVPAATDLFGASAPSWIAGNATSSAGAASVSNGRVDVGSPIASGPHLAFAASAFRLASQTTNPAAVTSLGGIGGPALAVAGPTTYEPRTTSPSAGSAPNATYVQATPESVGKATTDQRCLSTGLGCPGNGPARLPFGLIAIGAAAVVAALLVALVAERRRTPKTPYPNAHLYPPGSATPNSSGPAARRPASGPATSEDDPLGHLW